ncbi:MAG: hypothetical protein AB1410_05165 [Acidobacteriota bacterium]
MKLKSITTKFIFIGILTLTFIAIYITTGYIFTHHIEGEARKINLAGRERMLTLRITFHLHRLTDLPSPWEKEYT